MIWTMRRPALQIRRWARLYEEVDRRGAVITAITHPIETVEFAKHPDLEVDIREVVEGFNLSKGQTQRLHLAVVRRKTSDDPAATPAPRYVGWITTRWSSQTFAFSAASACRLRGFVRPKNFDRSRRLAAGVEKTHTPAGSVPRHSTKTRFTNPRPWPR